MEMGLTVMHTPSDGRTIGYVQYRPSVYVCSGWPEWLYSAEWLHMEIELTVIVTFGDSKMIR